MIYNLKTHHVEFLHKKPPRIVKESRRKHAKLKKGRHYQFIAGATALIVVIAGSLEAAAVSVPQSLTHEGRYRAARAAKNTTQKILKLVLVSKRNKETKRHLTLALSASRVFQSFQHLDKKKCCSC